jgi:hypothetical protein
MIWGCAIGTAEKIAGKVQRKVGDVKKVFDQLASSKKCGYAASSRGVAASLA